MGLFVLLVFAIVVHFCQQTVKTEIAQFETRKKLLTYAVPSSSR